MSAIVYPILGVLMVGFMGLFVILCSEAILCIMDLKARNKEKKNMDENKNDRQN